MTGPLEQALRTARDSGRKLLVPYVTGGVRDNWTSVVQAVAVAGADAIEIGVPFSDPVMDGPTIQEASQRALQLGATPTGVISALRPVDVGVPMAAMTYYNVIFRTGHRRFAQLLKDSRIDGAIVPDVPLEELADWERAAIHGGIETVLLASPVTPDERLAEICERSHGFIYAVSLMGVTGERERLADTAAVIAKRLKSITDKPVLIGVGVSTPEQAVEACVEADGVVVGSALMRRVLDGASPDEAGAFVGELRAALDG